MSTNCIEEDVNRIKKKLEKMLKANEIEVSPSIDMLNVLKNLQINLQLLQSTRIGVVVNNLRKTCSSDELGTLAKNLLKSWKKLVSNEGTHNNGLASKNHSPTSNFDDANDKDNSNSVPTSPPVTHQSFNHPTPSSASSSSSSLNQYQSNGKPDLSRHNSSDTSTHTPQLSRVPERKFIPPKAQNISYTETKDEVRLKSRELLVLALKLPDTTDTTLTFANSVPIAARCEDVIFAEFKNTDQKYRNRIRSRIANLKDPKNPKLRENVLLGLIPAEKLATMTADEMASDDLKQLREKYTKESIDDHQMAVQTGAKSSLLKCRKCKGSNCGFTEMQTRSADEPMTVFAYCLDCGNRWRQ
jgi:transcription elongation factor S-II